jgi:hypothetical protein
LFPTEEAFNYIFGFIETGDFTQALADAEYDGSNFIVTMGTVPVLVLIGVMIAITQKIVFAIAYRTNKC